VDENGVPIGKAKVNVDPKDGKVRISIVDYGETDSDGRFLIERLEWGEYRVFAMKEDAGYPNLAASFYSHNVFPSVTIGPANPIAHIQIQLGPRSGVLVGSVTDATNGGPVNAGFKLTRAESPNEWLSRSVPSEYRILLPPSVETILEVSSPGFKTWSPEHPLRLDSGAEMRLDISLQPLHDASSHPSRFMVPEGYVGWILLEYDAKGTPAPPDDLSERIFRFPDDGRLRTPSPGPESGADDEYLFYSSDGSTRPIPMTYGQGTGMIWGKYEGFIGGVKHLFGFFVGTKEQYKKYVSLQTRPGRISSP
jgi:hypothetical protein